MAKEGAIIFYVVEKDHFRRIKISLTNQKTDYVSLWISTVVREPLEYYVLIGCNENDPPKVILHTSALLPSVIKRRNRALATILQRPFFNSLQLHQFKKLSISHVWTRKGRQSPRQGKESICPCRSSVPSWSGSPSPSLWQLL